MRDYHRWMGGVDIHDQLRLQHYSLQLSVRFRKYYKEIFLGLVDMAVVNAFIVYSEAKKQQGNPPADHAKFLEVLQAQLLQTTADNFIDEVYTAFRHPDMLYIGLKLYIVQSLPICIGNYTRFHHTKLSSCSHRCGAQLSEFPEWVQLREGFRKRPQHLCKVCSVRKTKVGHVYLCDRVRPEHYPNNNMTCHQIWHGKWRNGDERPRPQFGRDIQMRGLGKKRRRRPSQDAEDGGQEEDKEEEQEGDKEEKEDEQEGEEEAKKDEQEEAEEEEVGEEES
ncbi:Hypothetical protein PHPALM_14904 [Phytophthora palmivora]|uniref:PiggyBac transposable element-derived protein domain-containing protein n=1 Tax=Phytophthora palmivora TaxID=4796 RepID=A0A2P4XTK0_9STRA|nr:Hypothetical protein PHPALM_14904 [Phytophthora palmivora]